jgi:CHAD domain-containing protein
MAATTHHETEAKFALDPGAPLPDLTRLKDVDDVERAPTVRLVATYYDTPDLRLEDRHIALRRRTGGSDAGWHLKVAEPDEPRERTELRAPLGSGGTGDDGAPEGLLDEVRAVIGRRRLVPIVTIDTFRTEHHVRGPDGTEVAVVSDDEVSSRRTGAVVQQAWRELEVEMVGHDPDAFERIVAQLTDAGLRPSPYDSKLHHALGFEPNARRTRHHRESAGDVLVRYLREQVDDLIRSDADVRAARDDGIHRMRVATRRIRSTLGTYRRLFEREITEPVRDELQWLGRTLSEARDVEILRQRLHDSVAELDVELRVGPVRPRIDQELGRRRRDARASVVDALSSDRYFAVLDQLEALVADPPLRKRGRRRGRREPARRLDASVRRVHRRAVHADDAPEGPERDRALHAVRKAAKRVRDSADAAEALVGKPARRLSSRAEDLQDLLGELQDGTAARRTLRQMGMVAHLAGENGFTFGVLVGREQQAAEAVRARYPKRLRRVLR